MPFDKYRHMGNGTLNTSAHISKCAQHYSPSYFLLFF
jgi:hypothetical protein